MLGILTLVLSVVFGLLGAIAFYTRLIIPASPEPVDARTASVLAGTGLLVSGMILVVVIENYFQDDHDPAIAFWFALFALMCGLASGLGWILALRAMKNPLGMFLAAIVTLVVVGLAGWMMLQLS